MRKMADLCDSATSGINAPSVDQNVSEKIDETNRTVDDSQNLSISSTLITNGDDFSAGGGGKISKTAALVRRSRSWSHGPTNNNNSNNNHNNINNLDVRGENASGSQSPSEISLSLSKPTSANLGCEMCSNYETRLQQLQDNDRRIRQQLASSQFLAERYKTELSAERVYRSEIETRFSTMSAQTEKEIQTLKNDLAQLDAKFHECEERNRDNLVKYRKSIDQAIKYRQSVEEQLNRLKFQYDKLLGKHRAQADVMQREAIDLPQTVEELQLFTLQLREELIESKASREHLEESLKSEILFMRDQLTSEQQSKEQLEQSLTEEINSLRTELAIVKSQQVEVDGVKLQLSDAHRQLEEHRSTIGDLEGALAILKHEKSAAEASNREHRQRASVLQQELDNCEQVQKDFVRLSQSLQIELEKIRQADHEVRWQHEEDVLVCNGCKIAFTRQKRKLHCRHCGRIFCESCLMKCVPSGPQHRAAHVCDVCHTLLVRDTAPYFSSQVPPTVATAETN